MRNFLIRRFFVLLITVFGAMALLFLLIQLIPGEPAATMLGPRATPEVIAQFREHMWLDKPFYMQLGRFIFNILQGDLGVDVVNRKPVSSLVFPALYKTLVLIISGIVLAVIFGIPLGVYSAVKRGTFFDTILGVSSITVMTIPAFVLGIYLLLVFTIYLRWFPGMGVGQSGNIIDQLKHLFLPAISISLLWIGYIARITRASMLEELNEDYVRAARARGLSEFKVIFKHTLRVAVSPVVAVLGTGVGSLIGGAVLIEIIFARPGLGYLIYTAIRVRNYPVVQGGVVMAVFLYACINFLADLSYGFIDPRIRKS